MNRQDAEELRDELNDVNIRCDPNVWYVGLSRDNGEYGTRIGIKYENRETVRFPKEVLEYVRKNDLGLYNVHHNEKMGLFADLLPVVHRDGTELQHTLGFERRTINGGDGNVYVFETPDGRKIKLPPDASVSELQSHI